MIAPPRTPVAPGAASERALFMEARRRRRRRWLAGIAAILAVSAVAAALTVAWVHLRPGQNPGRRGSAVMALPGRSSATVAVWYDGIRLRTGDIYPSGRMTQQAGPEASAASLPLVAAGGRVYWVNPMGGPVSFRPYTGWWPSIVQYLDLATGKIATAGPGATAFLSSDGRYLFMAQDSTTLSELAVAGGSVRQLSVPSGWYLPGGNGTAELGYQGLATADGVIVESRESGNWHPQVFGLWNPGSHTVRVLGQGLAVIAAYTPPGARYSLLAWLGACRFPYNCKLKITNTATMATRTVRSPLPGGFAVGGAFSPDGTRLAVFPQTLPKGPDPGYARLALVNSRTGAVRLASRPRITLGLDLGWALWLPDGRHLIMGLDPGSYLVDAATLSARPLFLARGHDVGSGQGINFTAAIVSPRS